MSYRNHAQGLTHKFICEEKINDTVISMLRLRNVIISKGFRFNNMNFNFILFKVSRERALSGGQNLLRYFGKFNVIYILSSMIYSKSVLKNFIYFPSGAQINQV